MNNLITVNKIMSNDKISESDRYSVSYGETLIGEISPRRLIYLIAGWNQVPPLSKMKDPQP